MNRLFIFRIVTLYFTKLIAFYLWNYKSPTGSSQHRESGVRNHCDKTSQIERETLSPWSKMAFSDEMWGRLMTSQRG